MTAEQLKLIRDLVVALMLGILAWYFLRTFKPAVEDKVRNLKKVKTKLGEVNFFGTSADVETKAHRAEVAGRQTTSDKESRELRGAIAPAIAIPHGRPETTVDTTRVGSIYWAGFDAMTAITRLGMGFDNHEVEKALSQCLHHVKQIKA
jgi:hypothetical protein